LSRKAASAVSLALGSPALAARPDRPVRIIVPSLFNTAPAGNSSTGISASTPSPE
jgi:hypothetical protein